MNARKQYLDGLRKGFIDRSYGHDRLESYTGTDPFLKGINHGIHLWDETVESLLILEPTEQKVER